MTKRDILIDLDGVLNEYGNSPFNKDYIPPLKKGAEHFLKNLSKTENLYLFTTRNVILATKWLLENNIDKYFEDVTNIKIPAHLYIDDRCICFDGDYKKALKQIQNFKTYWQKS